MDAFTPPNSKQSEIAVLGAILKDARKLEDLELNPDEFYFSSHRHIFKTMRDLMMTGIPVDIITVAESLESAGLIEETGGIPYLAEITENTVASNIPAYARNVRNMAKARRVIQIGQDMQAATGDQWQNILDSAVRDLMSMDSGNVSYEHKLKDALTGALDYLQQACDADGLVGVDAGLEKLNDVLGGFHPSDLIVIGARPAMGKTALVIFFLKAALAAVGFISTEQPGEQIALRMIASEGRIVATKLRNADLDESGWGQVTSAITRLQEAQIFINDQSAITISEITQQARRWKRNHNIKALYVDYLQRIKPANANLPKHEQIGEIAIALKDLARELQIPVIALAQVNRTVEQRPDKRPRMGDLKHSGEIEQEADQIILLYRDEVYNADTADVGIAELLIDKNRHGPTGMVKVAWLGEYMRFENLAYSGGSYSKQDTPY